MFVKKLLKTTRTFRKNSHLIVPLVLIVFYVFWFILPNENQAQAIVQSNLFLPTDLHAFIQKPWTIFTFFLFHENPIVFILNLAGFFIFSSLTGNLLGKKIVLPLFLFGNIAGAFLLLFFHALPLSQALSFPAYSSGSSGGIMALILVSTYYIPKKIVRFYGIFPIKLKYLGIVLPALSIVFLLANKMVDLQLHYLGGYICGFLFAVAIRRGHVNPSNLKPVRAKRKAPVYSYASSNLKSTLKPEVEPEIVSPEEYLDHLLEKISVHGMDMLTPNEKQFLADYSKKMEN